MSVALELPAITISLPISKRVLVNASLSAQNPKFLIEQSSNGKQPNLWLTLTELARLNQTIQILFNLHVFKNHLSQWKKNTTSLASQVTEESTNKPVAVDLADHVNLNYFIFDGNETERPPFQINCGCCSDKIECICSFLVLFFHYFMIGAIVFFSVGYLAFAENSSLQTGIIANLSTSTGYLVPKGKHWISAFAPTLITSFPL